MDRNIGGKFTAEQLLALLLSRIVRDAKEALADEKVAANFMDRWQALLATLSKGLVPTIRNVDDRATVSAFVEDALSKIKTASDGTADYKVGLKALVQILEPIDDFIRKMI